MHEPKEPGQKIVVQYAALQHYERARIAEFYTGVTLGFFREGIAYAVVQPP